ncbi:MAG: hypothetical protein R3B84_08820 [Zavarzinella sp.]
MLYRASTCAVLSLFSACALSLLGCGGGGGSTYDVTGMVTFQGKPVPKGFITFEPDTAKGNTGPGGGATIVNGKFKTDKGKGVVGGPYIVKIVGYDGIVANQSGEELTDGKPLFAPYVTNFDFPKEDSDQKFEVPDSQANE